MADPKVWNVAQGTWVDADESTPPGTVGSDGSTWTGSEWVRSNSPEGQAVLGTGQPLPRGTGQFEGYLWNGRQWIPDPSYRPPAPGGVPVIPVHYAPPPGAVWNGQTWIAPPPEGRSAGRTIGGIVALVVAGFAGLQGISWFTGYVDLDRQGNQFAGMLVVLALGAFVVAAAFGIWGITLLSKKR